ncbi:MAG TPA: prohibitin family protein [Methanosarcinales archaeon]|nr:prohibitin family protein [Methanosarcinales archaeon]
MADYSSGDEDAIKAIKLAVVCVILGVLLIVVLFGSWYTVKSGERGVLLTWGRAKNAAIEPGFHFKWPIAQKAIKIEVRTQKVETVADAASKDLQDVQTTIALNFHLNPGEVSNLYQEVGVSYQERIIDPSIQESIKAVSAKFTAEELITKRADVKREAKELLNEKLAKYYITVDDFNIVNFQFSPEFDKAIESKVTAEQLKLKAERDLERIKIEKEQKIAQAQAEAESLRLQKAEITPDLIELRKIEVAMKELEVRMRFADAFMEKWNGQLPTFLMGGNQDMLPLMDVTQFSTGGQQ